MKLAWLLLPAAVALALLHSRVASAEPQENVRIRVANRPGFDVHSAEIRFPGHRVAFDGLKNGEVSSYKDFKTIYSNVFVKITTDNGRELYNVPDDYLDGPWRTSGSFTCVLRIDATAPNVLDLHIVINWAILRLN